MLITFTKILVFDMKNTTWRHFPKVVLSTLRLFMKYNQEFHPVVVRQVHIVNCTSLLNLVLNILKPMMSAQVASYIHTHLPDSETIFKFIPKDILPEEYGGTGDSIESTRDIWVKYLDSYR